MYTFKMAFKALHFRQCHPNIIIRVYQFYTGNSDMRTLDNLYLSIWGLLEDLGLGSDGASWSFGQKNSNNKQCQESTRYERNHFDSQLNKIIETRIRETLFNLNNCIESITSVKFNKDHSGFYRWRIRFCLFISAIETSLTTYSAFTLDFFGLIWDCSKEPYSLENSHPGLFCFIKALRKESFQLFHCEMGQDLYCGGIQSKISFTPTKSMKVYTTTAAVNSHSHTKITEEGTCCAADLIFKILPTLRIIWHCLLVRVFGQMKVSSSAKLVLQKIVFYRHTPLPPNIFVQLFPPISFCFWFLIVFCL